MNFLAGALAILADKLFARLISWVNVLLIKRAEERKHKAEEVIYDKNVADALEKYKNAATAKEQEDALGNLTNAARRR